jgi:hypothetical protein
MMDGMGLLTRRVMFDSVVSGSHYLAFQPSS